MSDLTDQRGGGRKAYRVGKTKKWIIMKNSTVFDNLVQELENQLLSNEEQVMLLAGEGQGSLFLLPLKKASVL